jgi:hypothetical protein
MVVGVVGRGIREVSVPGAAEREVADGEPFSGLSAR